MGVASSSHGSAPGLQLVNTVRLSFTFPSTTREFPKPKREKGWLSLKKPDMIPINKVCEEIGPENVLAEAMTKAVRGAEGA